MTIKSKLITVLLIIAAVPMLLVGVMNFVYSQQTITADTLNSLEQLSVGIKDLILQEVEQNEARFEQLRTDQDILNVLSTSSGGEASLLNAKVEENPNIHAILLLDNVGNIIASGSELQGSLEYFKHLKPIAGNAISVDLIQQSPNLWDLVTFGTIRQGNKQGKLIILSDARSFTRITTDFVGFGESGDIFLTAPDYHGNVKFVSPRRFASHPDAMELIPKNLLEINEYELFSGADKSYASAVDYRGQMVLGVSKPIETVGWNVILKIDRAEALGQLEQIKRTLLYLMSATLLIVLLLALYFSGTITRPIQVLSEAMKRADKGDFELELKPTTKDELRDLTLSFNKMIQSIREQEHEKYDFITSASHQLRTPSSALNWQLGMLQDLADRKNDGELKELVKDIKQNNRETVTVIDDLLKVLELGDHYRVVKGESISLKPLVDMVLESYSDEAQDKNMTIKKDIPDGLNVLGDENWLKEVIVNLIDNALTYSNENGEVRISASRQDEGIQIQIADDGIGIPKKQHMHVFDKFFRGENAYAKKNVGSGLGLVIVKTVIEGHGGKVTFVSDEGQGMIWTIILPGAN
jgi:signal transduction histidine kinase